MKEYKISYKEIHREYGLSGYRDIVAAEKVYFLKASSYTEAQSKFIEEVNLINQDNIFLENPITGDVINISNIEEISSGN